MVRGVSQLTMTKRSTLLRNKKTYGIDPMKSMSRVGKAKRPTVAHPVPCNMIRTSKSLHKSRAQLHNTTD